MYDAQITCIPVPPTCLVQLLGPKTALDTSAMHQAASGRCVKFNGFRPGKRGSAADRGSDE